jgi:hypothetical protein
VRSDATLQQSVMKAEANCMRDGMSSAAFDNSIEKSPFTLEYNVKGGRHTVTITARDELPDELHLRLSDEAFAADRTVNPAAASLSGCEPVGLQKTLRFSEIPFQLIDGVHTATLTIDFPASHQETVLGGEAAITDGEGAVVSRTPRGSVLAVVTADDRSWSAYLQPKQD